MFNKKRNNCGHTRQVTYSTKIQINEKNCELIKYFDNWRIASSQIQRRTYHAITAMAREHDGKLDYHNKLILHHRVKNDNHLTSRATDAIVNRMEARFNSTVSLTDYQLDQAKQRITGLLDAIDDWNLKKELARGKLNNNPEDAKALRLLHIAKARLHGLHNALNRTYQKIDTIHNEQRSGRYKLVFGTKKLFDKSFKTGDKTAFRDQRDSEISLIGRAADVSGNNNFRLTYNDRHNSFDVRWRKEFDLDAGKFVTGRVHFWQDATRALKSAILSKSSPLLIMVKYRNGSYYLFVTISIPCPEVSTTVNSGAVGVDFNKGFIAISETDSRGNLACSWRSYYPYASGGARKSRFYEQAHEVASYALSCGKSVVVEDLDFRRKRGRQVSGQARNYNRMLSSLAYSSYLGILGSVCARYGVELVRVNPAWTSRIGASKYRWMCLNGHEAAAFVIARRGCGYKDKLKNG